MTRHPAPDAIGRRAAARRPEPTGARQRREAQRSADAGLRWLGSALVAIGLSLHVGRARATPPAETRASEPPGVRHEPGASLRWYGYETLLVDGGALALLVAGIATYDPSIAKPIQIASGAVFVLGGPALHMAHARGLASLGSLGLRLGLPLAGGLLGVGLAALGPYDDGDESVRGILLGGLGGVVAAVALDAALLAWDSEAQAAPAAASAELGLRPWLSATASCWQLGVVTPF